MILGFLEILLAGFLNVAILTVPFIGIEILRQFITNFLLRIKVRSYLAIALTYLFCVVLGLLIAAAIQMRLWQLVPRQDPANWRMAVISYAVGAGAIMLYRLYHNKSQADRRNAIWFASLNTVLFMAIFGASFVSYTVYDGIRHIPNRVVRFVAGTV